jgi:cold shock CspA family protein
MLNGKEMRIHGTLKKWNDERGFGFLESPGSDKEIFVHISAFPRDGARPRIGEMVSFEMRSGQDGKVRAVAIQRPEAATTARRQRRAAASSKPKPFALVPIIVVLGLLGYAGYRLFLSQPQIVADLGFGIPQTARDDHQTFTCDGRQYCSDMTSRAEAVYFIRNCPDTKMDGDHDGVPCENDSRF